MSVDALVPEVRGALAVSSSYDDEKIPALIRRTVNRLLRDYHFPKAVVQEQFSSLVEGQTVFDLPSGFKKELEFRLYDPDTLTFTDPLVKRENFQLPYPTGAPHFYWLQGTQLVLDTPLTSSMTGFQGLLWYESMDAGVNEDWLTADFPDAVFYLSVTRGCAEFRKPEVMQIYGPLWQDEQQSLAIYLNELEWNNIEVNMKQAHRPAIERYPR